MSPKVDYGLFRAYALPQSCPTFAIRGAPPPLLAHVGRAPSIILPLEQARCQNDTFGTVIMLCFKSINGKPETRFPVSHLMNNDMHRTSSSDFLITDPSRISADLQLP